MKSPNIAASVRHHLLTLAQSKGWELNRVLACYGVERTFAGCSRGGYGSADDFADS
jgi:hypothetical protein